MIGTRRTKDVVLKMETDKIYEHESRLYSIIIASFNSPYRKLNRQRSVFPSDKALLKALYLTTFEAAKK